MGKTLLFKYVFILPAYWGKLNCQVAVFLFNFARIETSNWSKFVLKLCVLTVQILDPMFSAIWNYLNRISRSKLKMGEKLHETCEKS